MYSLISFINFWKFSITNSPNTALSPSSSPFLMRLLSVTFCLLPSHLNTVFWILSPNPLKIQLIISSAVYATVKPIHWLTNVIIVSIVLEFLFFLRCSVNVYQMSWMEITKLHDATDVKMHRKTPTNEPLQCLFHTLH